MSEAGPQIPEAPVPRADWRDRHGATLRAILVGCGSVFLALLLVLGATLYLVSRDPRDRRLAEGLIFDSLESEVSGGTAAPPARGELEAAYARFRKDWSDERIREEDGERVRHAFLDLTRRPRVTDEDIRALARRLDAVARTAPRKGR